MSRIQIKWKMQAVEHEPGGFIPVMLGAMPEKHLLFVHPAAGPANQIENGGQLTRVLDQGVEWIGLGVTPGRFRMC